MVGPSLRVSLLLLLWVLIPTAVMFSAASAQSSITLEGCHVSTASGTSAIQEYAGPVSLTVSFYINNPGPPSMVGLGVTVTSSSTGQQYYDPANDLAVQIQNGPSSPSRLFVQSLPATAEGVGYSVTCAIWSGQPGASQLLSSNNQNPIPITVYGSP